jgi:hypothetical protein
MTEAADQESGQGSVWILYTLLFSNEREYSNENTSYSLNFVMSTLNFLTFRNCLESAALDILLISSPPILTPSLCDKV